MFQLKKPEKSNIVYYRSAPGSKIREKFRSWDDSAQGLAYGAIVVMAVFCMILSFHSITSTLIYLPLLAVLSLVSTLLFASDTIHIAERGIAFPLNQLFSLQMRLPRLWSEIDTAKVVSPSNSDSPIVRNGSFLQLTFKSGGKVELRLADFTRESLSTLTSAIQEWAIDGDVDRQQLEHLPRLWDYEQGELAGSRSISYTKFWEEELANNYSFTSYVTLQVGQRINQELVVEKQLAAGGFSAIYLVKNAANKQFVLKESVVPATADEKMREKAKEHFRREAQILIKLDHPLIAKVYDHFLCDGRDYLLLQYIVGPDARELIRHQGAQPVDKVMHWSKQMGEVLSYLHHQTPSVVHRDLSPDNVVIDDKGNAVLIDFGAANEFVGQATGTLVGKQAYMSPEQIRGKVTPQSDIYSLGATIYFLLTGKDPEPLASCQPSSLNAAIPAELDRLVNRCTKLDTGERIASADDFLLELEAVCKPNAPVVNAT